MLIMDSSVEENYGDKAEDNCRAGLAFEKKRRGEDMEQSQYIRKGKSHESIYKENEPCVSQDIQYCCEIHR